jgi:hypothetical protein
VSGVNYFFRSATIIFPYQRQLLLRRRGAPPRRWRAIGPPSGRFLGLREETGVVVAKRDGKVGNLVWFSTFPDRFARAVGMWKSRRLLARFPRGSWKAWEACFWLSTLSTAPAFPQLPGLVFFAPSRFAGHSCSARPSACCFFLASSSR